MLTCCWLEIDWGHWFDLIWSCSYWTKKYHCHFHCDRCRFTVATSFLAPKSCSQLCPKFCSVQSWSIKFISSSWLVCLYFSAVGLHSNSPWLSLRVWGFGTIFLTVWEKSLEPQLHFFPFCHLLYTIHYNQIFKSSFFSFILSFIILYFTLNKFQIHSLTNLSGYTVKLLWFHKKLSILLSG